MPFDPKADLYILEDAGEIRTCDFRGLAKEDLTAWPRFPGPLALKESGPHVLRTLQQLQRGLHMAED